MLNKWTLGKLDGIWPTFSGHYLNYLTCVSFQFCLISLFLKLMLLSSLLFVSVFTYFLHDSICFIMILLSVLIEFWWKQNINNITFVFCFYLGNNVLIITAMSLPPKNLRAKKNFFMLNHIKKYLESIRKQNDSVAFCTFSWNTYRSIESRISALLDWQQSDTVASLPAIPSQFFFFLISLSWS